MRLGVICNLPLKIVFEDGRKASPGIVTPG
jgi:hypothetical protein